MSLYLFSSSSSLLSMRCIWCEEMFLKKVKRKENENTLSNNTSKRRQTSSLFKVNTVTKMKNSSMNRKVLLLETFKISTHQTFLRSFKHVLKLIKDFIPISQPLLCLTFLIASNIHGTGRINVEPSLTPSLFLLSSWGRNVERRKVNFLRISRTKHIFNKFYMRETVWVLPRDWWCVGAK